jgi:hypothetical protein
LFTEGCPNSVILIGAGWAAAGPAGPSAASAATAAANNALLILKGMAADLL